jgi:addiction module RelE/StbE family toxin
MYEIVTRNKKVEKRLNDYINHRSDIVDKLKRLKLNPRRECGAHPLYGELAGKLACWLGSNIRMVYKIDDIGKLIIVEKVGTHKVY